MLDNEQNPQFSSDDLASQGIRGVSPLSAMASDTEEATAQLFEMHSQARNYLLSFAWCKNVLKEYFGDGFAGIVAVFLFEVQAAASDLPVWYWVVVGDLPPGILVTDDLKSPYDALVAYMALRMRWVRYALKNEAPPPEVMPVESVPATEYWGRHLLDRINSINQHFLPHFRRE